MSEYKIIAESIKRYLKSPKGKKAHKESNKRYYLNHLEYYRERNRKYRIKLALAKLVHKS